MNDLPWAPRIGLEAARWARGWNGDAAFHNMCKAFVRSVFDIEPSQSGTAIECFNETRHPHKLTAATIDDVPQWVPIWYDTSNPAEHVAFTLRRQRKTGRRLAITTDARSGQIGIVTARDLLSWGPVIGWAEDFDGKRVWEDR